MPEIEAKAELVASCGLVGFVLRSDRAACIDQIKRLGLEGHATTMAAARSQTIRR